MAGGTLDIGQYLTHKSIFITGGTGFLGKVLIEKMLRDCEGVDRIYMLLRASNSQELSKRFEKFKTNEVFRRINAEKNASEVFEKLIPICGDVSQNVLGLTSDDEDVLKTNVNVIFHCAAKIKFNMGLREAVAINVQGTQNLLNIAMSMRKLEVFVHMSTAYSNILNDVVKEVIYPPLLDCESILKMCRVNDVNAIKTVERTATVIVPNMYVLSKNLAEGLVYEARKHFPVTIIRPSLVTPSHSDPFPGWVDSIYGPMGIIVGAGTGIIRTTFGCGEICSDYVPVDFCVNNSLAAAASVGSMVDKSCPVYNSTTSSDCQVSWAKFLELGDSVFRKYPFDKFIWYPTVSIERHFLLYVIKWLLFQLIPALFIDAYRIVTFKKAKLVNTQWLVFQSNRFMASFVRRQWTWKNDNHKKLFKTLTPANQKMFNFESSSLNFEEYMTVFMLGVRRHILRMKDETIPHAKKKLQQFFYIYCVTKIVCISVFLYFCVNWFSIHGSNYFNPFCDGRCSAKIPFQHP